MSVGSAVLIICLGMMLVAVLVAIFNKGKPPFDI
jgi:hypothetical protein